MPLEARRDAVALVLEAVSRAKDDGKIEPAMAFAIRLAALIRPRAFKRRAEQAVEALLVDLPGMPVGPAAGSYEFDIDTFEKLLQLLIEYLPKILEIILPLFSSKDD